MLSTLLGVSRNTHDRKYHFLKVNLRINLSALKNLTTTTRILLHFYSSSYISSYTCLYVSMSCDTVMTLQDRGDSKFKLEIII